MTGIVLACRNTMMNKTDPAWAVRNPSIVTQLVSWWHIFFCVNTVIFFAFLFVFDK